MAEHACRLKDPGDFDKFRRGKRKHNGKEYGIIFGRPKDGGGWQEQAYRYDTETWNADEAKDHCKGHDGKFDAAEAKGAGTSGGGESLDLQARRLVAGLVAGNLKLSGSEVLLLLSTLDPLRKQAEREAAQRAEEAILGELLKV